MDDYDYGGDDIDVADVVEVDAEAQPEDLGDEELEDVDDDDEPEQEDEPEEEHDPIDNDRVPEEGENLEDVENNKGSILESIDRDSERKGINKKDLEEIAISEAKPNKSNLTSGDSKLDPRGLVEKKKIAAERITPKWLTKYEKARLVGVRAMMFENDSPSMLPFSEIENLRDPILISKLEKKKKVIPMIVIRVRPDGYQEIWDANEFVKEKLKF